MARKLFFTILLVLLALEWGCVTDTHTKQGDSLKAGAVSESVSTAIGASADTFLKLVSLKDYDKIADLVLPSEREGFDGAAFVEDRFRMKPHAFQAYAWDIERIGVTRVKDSKDILSSIVVAVRVLATNEGQPVFVNLRWRRRAMKWYIVAYPEK